ncbi:hypothetical protein [Microvirga sp. TS319]|uniref:DUF6894 family protein n=1 Tax=Microvirga sp. TS319 TaxID=3241165 RepID=UPI00351AAA3E
MIDDEGVEVRDLDQAWAQALKAVMELRAEADGEPIEWDRWRLEATDSDGCVLFTIKLTHNLH